MFYDCLRCGYGCHFDKETFDNLKRDKTKSICPKCKDLTDEEVEQNKPEWDHQFKTALAKYRSKYES
jgi:hypothetical protein